MRNVNLIFQEKYEMIPVWAGPDTTNPKEVEDSTMMTEPVRIPDKRPDNRLHLLSKEMEEAANAFLMKVEQLEKLLPLVEE